MLSDLSSVGESWAGKVLGGYNWLVCKPWGHCRCGTEGCLSLTAAGSISMLTAWALRPGHPILSIPELPGRPGMVAFPIRRGDVYSLSSPGPPFIVSPPENITVNISQDALLTCRAEAYPGNLTYTWYWQDENVYFQK